MSAIKLSTEGKAILAKALRNIKRYPDSFDMGDFLKAPAMPLTKKETGPACGTAACFAGHIAIAGGLVPRVEVGGVSISIADCEITPKSPLARVIARIKRRAKKEGATPEEIHYLARDFETVAAELLGVTTQETGTLFYEQFDEAHRDPKARVAEWLETGA